MTKIDKHENAIELAAWLSTYVANILQDAVGNKGSASIAVSGGSTPKLLFAELAKQAIDWAKISVTLVDERWVPISNDRSNAKMVKELLLTENAAKATFIPLFNENIAADEIAKNASDFENLLPFDVVILGMGNDGHTASFFPGGSNLDEATDPKTDLILTDIEADGAGEPRVTFTLPVLAAAHHLILHIEGEEKKRVLLEATKDGDMNELPIRHILNARKDMKIVWT